MLQRRIWGIMFVGLLVIVITLFFERKRVPSPMSRPAAPTQTASIIGMPPAPSSPSLQGQITLGAVLPLSGAASAYGLSLQNSILLASEEINHQNGVAGKRLNILFADGACDSKQTVAQARDLIERQSVFAFVGGGCPVESAALAALSREKNVFVLAPATHLPTLDASPAPLVYHLLPPATRDVLAEARFAVRILHARKAAIIAEQDPDDRALAEAYSKGFTAEHGSVVLHETYKTGTLDFRILTLKLKASKPDVVFLAPRTSAPGLVIVFHARQAGLSLPIFTTQTLTNRLTLNDYADRLSGVYGVEPAFDQNDPNVERFIQEYKTRFGQEATWPVWMLNAYNATYLMKTMLEQGAHDGPSLSRALSAQQVLSFGTLSQARFDPQHALVLHDYRVFHILPDQTTTSTKISL